MSEPRPGPGPLPEGAPGFGLVDVHVHVGSSDSDEAYYPTLTGAEYQQHARAAGVVAAHAFAPYRRTGYRDTNDALRRWAAGTGGEVGAFARLGGRYPAIAQWPPRPWQLRRRIRPVPARSDVPGDLAGFTGVKLLPHLDGMPPPRDRQEVADRRLPVLVHGGRFVTPAWVVRRVLSRTTGPVVLAHLGAFPHEERLLVSALELAARHPRLYLDTSGVWDSDFLRRAARAVPGKLVFGSDAPLTTPAVAWQHVASAITDPGVLRALGHDTPVSLGLGPGS